MEKILLTVILGSIFVFSCTNNENPNAIYDQYHLDSIISAKEDSFKKLLVKKTDSLLLESSKQYIDSLNWADSLLKSSKK